MGLCGSSEQAPPVNEANSAYKAENTPSTAGGGESKTNDVNVEHTKTKKAMVVKKRAAIFAERVDVNVDFTPDVVQKSAGARQTITAALREHFLFEDLDAHDQGVVVDAMTSRPMKRGDVIIQEGDTVANAFFVLETGTAYAETGSAGRVKDYGVAGGDGKVNRSFGELALLYNCARAASIKCETAGQAWALDRQTFRHVLANASGKLLAISKDALRQHEMLAKLTDQQLNKVSEAVAMIHYSAGEVIIRKGDRDAEVFYFLKEGKVKCTEAGADGKGDLEIEAGSEHSYFGERALIHNEPRAANVIATTDCTCMTLDRTTFVELLGPLADVMDHNLGLRVLRSVPMLQHLDDDEMRVLIRSLEREQFDEGMSVIRQGEVGSTFYIIREGSVDVLKSADGGEPVFCATLGHGQYFGEQALLNDEPRNSTIRAKGPVECFVLSREKFVDLLGPLQAIMEREADVRQQTAEEKMAEKRNEMYADIGFEDLKQVKTLGTGTFGRVKLVQHRKRPKEQFAMKILQKAQVVAYRQQANVINEKEIISAANHPFILKMICTHHDQNCLYMVLELVIGGELFSLLHNKGGSVDVPDARFYAACTLDVFEYLHKRDVVYRDLKPENLLIDDEGYIKVCDFGFAKKVIDRTYTLCGTPEYLAPELVLGKGHNRGVDIWALGILVYEMLFQFTPFADHNAADHMVICKNIVKCNIPQPPAADENAMHLVAKLLKRDPHKRLGCGKDGAKAIKTHRFFAPIDFEALIKKELPAPWTPPLEVDQNFEAYEEDDRVEPYMDDGTGWDAGF